MRIVGGKFRGRSLATPESVSIRPTSDRVREALFNILAHGSAAMAIDGINVLDLYAGTGALGIEAISRGAAQCLFVDDAAEARGLIRDNVEALGLTGITKIFRRDATALGDAGKYGPFQLVLVDPPYGKGLGEKALASALAGGWLADDAMIVLEEDSDVEIALPSGLTLLDRRIWGGTQAIFARRNSSTIPSHPA